MSKKVLPEHHKYLVTFHLSLLGFVLATLGLFIILWNQSALYENLMLVLLECIYLISYLFLTLSFLGFCKRLKEGKSLFEANLRIVEIPI